MPRFIHETAKVGDLFRTIRCHAVLRIFHAHEHHRWRSPRLNRDMEIKVYGHWGKPFIVFPCSRGRYFDFEGMGMVAEIAGFIDAGKLKLYCVDSVDSESWYNYAVPPGERNARHEAYDGYWPRRSCPSSGSIAGPWEHGPWPPAAAWGPTTP
jgi:esterase/lipase superfamily enzyme